MDRFGTGSLPQPGASTGHPDVQDSTVGIISCVVIFSRGRGLLSGMELNSVEFIDMIADLSYNMVTPKRLQESAA